MHSNPLEVTVKMSSEVQTLPVRTTNYNVCKDHRKGKIPDIFVKSKLPSDKILKPEKENISRKPRHMVNIP
jgi:hypothetical protein